MDINVYDNYNFYDKRPENLEYFHFYNRKVENFTYNKKDMKNAIIKHLKSKKLSAGVFPWGETKNSDKSIKFASILAENYTEEELGDAPMLINFNYLSDTEISEEGIVSKVVKDFKSQVTSIKFYANKMGSEEYFESTLNSFMSNPEVNQNRQVTERLSKFNLHNGGFITTYLAKLPQIHNKFEYYKKFPIFISTKFDSSLGKYTSNPTSSFGEILINSHCFSNSPMDIVVCDPRVEHNTIGNKKIKTIEELCSFILTNLNITNDPIIDIFTNRIDGKNWNDNLSNYDDKMYYIENIELSEKKDNYYEDCIDLIYNWRKIYNIIVNFEFKDDSIDEYRRLLDKIISDGQ